MKVDRCRVMRPEGELVNGALPDIRTPPCTEKGRGLLIAHLRVMSCFGQVPLRMPAIPSRSVILAVSLVLFEWFPGRRAFPVTVVIIIT